MFAPEMSDMRLSGSSPLLSEPLAHVPQKLQTFAIEDMRRA